MDTLCTSRSGALAAALLGLTGALSAQHAAPATLPVVRPPVLPDAIASFGAARSGDWLYVYGGHVGRAHEHTAENVVGAFRRLRLPDGEAWEELPPGPPLQSAALVAAPDGSLLRIGGMTAHNPKDAPEDLHSTASVQRFDPDVGRWEDVTPLPEPRSSHDACVLGSKLYVVGGWRLAGEDGGEWHRTAWVAELAALGDEPLMWAPLPAPPFERRACAVAPAGDRIAVVGGMDEDGPLAAVAFFDPASGTWESGPDLPGSGFGAAAVWHEGSLWASGMDGRLARLAEDRSGWTVVGQLAVPRFFHRFVAAADGSALLALGGAGRGGHMRTVERVPIAEAAARVVQEWRLPFAGAARRRFAAVVDENAVHVFGGNRGSGEDRFAADQYVDEVWKVDLAAVSVTPAGRLPAPRQSLVAVPLKSRGHAFALVGGLGPAAEAVEATAGEAGSQASACVYDARSGELHGLEAALPTPRTQFQAVLHEGRVWVFGGIDFTPGSDTADHPTEVLVFDPNADATAFVPSGIELPRPRRSFGAAVLGTKCYLIGGLGPGFEPVTECDVFDFATREWTTAEGPPTAWVSPQVAAVCGRIVVACGGTMSGRRFTEVRRVEAFEPGRGWTTAVEELPFAPRNARMLGLRDRLLFCSIEEADAPEVVIRLLKLRATDLAPERSFHR